MALFSVEDGVLLPGADGLTDEQSRALELGQHVLVAAGAGSGKTRTLTRRYLRILGAFAWEAALGKKAPGPEAILVSTFTERAAAEMRARIRSELGVAVRELRDRREELAEKVSGGAERVDAVLDHLAACKRGFDRARIGTFHSFAASTLREMAAHAGLDPGFQILEQADESLLRERAVEEALFPVERHGQPAALFMLERRALLDVLRTWVRRRHDLRAFSATLDRSDEALLELWHDRYADVALDELERELSAGGHLFGLLEAFADLEHDLRDPTRPPTAIAHTKRALLMMAEPPPLHPVERADRLRTIVALFRTGGGLKHVAKAHASWTGSQSEIRYPDRKNEIRQAWADLRPVLVEVFGEHGERLESLLGGPDRIGIPVLRALHQVGSEAVHRYQAHLDEARCLDFAELEARLLHLLTTSDSARRRLQRRFRHVLVDEFQDTNTTQWRVVKLLLGQPMRTSGLFVVGDPKQAIYRFRGGDVTVFERARRELGGVGGLDLAFTWNFRSRPALIEGFNALFGWLMPPLESEDPSWEARFEPLTAKRWLAPGDDHRGQIDLVWLTEEDDEQDEEPGTESLAGDVSAPAVPDEPPPPADGFDVLALDAAERAAAREAHAPVLGNLPPVHREARMVANLVRDVLLPSSASHEGIRVALLLRRRTHLPVYARALREEGVPHVVARGRGFFGRQEVQDLGNLLLSLAHPDDAIALLGALRGPLLRLEDAWLVWLVHASRGERSSALQRAWRDVLRLAEATGPERDELVEKLEWGELPAEGQTALLDAAHRFLRWRALTRELPLSGFLRQVVTETASVYGLAKTDPTGQAMANVEKLISLALAYDSRGAEGLADFADFLGQQDAMGADEGDATLDATAPVVLMTIHQSKGLEFPTVVLPDIAQLLRFRANDAMLLARLPSPNEESPSDAPDRWEPGIAIPIVEDGKRERRDMLLRRLIRRQDRWEDIAEARRLLYVAATRARDRLVTLSLPLAATALDRVESGAPKDTATSWSEWLRMGGGLLQSKGARLMDVGPNARFPTTSQQLEAAQMGAELRARGDGWIPEERDHTALADLPDVARAISAIEAEPLRHTSPHALQRDAPPAAPTPADLRPPPELDPRSAGLLRGLLVHGCLEDGLTKPSAMTRRRVKQALAAEGQLSDAAEAWLHAALVRHLRGYRKAAPPELNAEDATVFRELPFRLRMPASTVTGGGASWLDGVIDAVYRRPEEKCWYVLDYKSDEGDPQSLAEAYLPQILAYAWAASRVLPDLRDRGWRVGGELLFTATGRRLLLFEPMAIEEVGVAFRRHLRAAGLEAEAPGPDQD
ncbi:MAG: UvrD-helicase domain-containing protein [Deltaproteobacteria bacterium]|nr:UvrD-helicase domain-containing protein [Deltaproteobacteria bacterium]